MTQLGVILLTILLQVLPPAGLYASVPWQVEEKSPGMTAEVVDTLQLDSYYDWKPEGALPDKHVPMLWTMPWNDDGTSPVFCEHTFLFNEPERMDQANLEPAIAAQQAAWYEAQQIAQCGYSNFSIQGNLLTVLNSTGWMDVYLANGGPVPDAWHVHMYAYTKEEMYMWWLQMRQELYDYPEFSMKNGKPIPVILTEVTGMNHSVDKNCDIIKLIYWLVKTDPILHSAYIFTGNYWKYSNKYMLTNPQGELNEIGECFMEVTQGGPWWDTIYIPAIKGQMINGGSATD